MMTAFESIESELHCSAKKLMRWSHCDDEIKMGEFLDKISDESKLRRFALEMACTVLEELEDQRLIDAVDAAEDFLNGAIAETDLEKYYLNAEKALEAIELRESDTEMDVNEMEYEKGLVALYAAIPPNLDHYQSALDAARNAALHTAHYCCQIRGSGELEDQVAKLELVELPSAV